MTFVEIIASNLSTIAIVLSAMAVLAFIETAIPLRRSERWRADHFAPNLALTCIALVTNLVLNAALVVGLLWLDARGLGLLRVLGLPAIGAAIIAIVVLDFATWAAHVAMHHIPMLWRTHRVHHCDPLVDVTTTIRQHPGEGLLRFVVVAAVALALGVGPAAFAVYRTWSVINGLLEHANVRVAAWIDRGLSWLVVTPNMHKIHHSRQRSQTDSNYGNIFSIFDRIFGTFTPTARVGAIAYGLDGYDDASTQTTAALLRMPFRAGAEPAPATRGHAGARTLRG